MNTFLPYPNFKKSAECLDYKRLGNQRNEARILIDTLIVGGGWKFHPCVKMWQGYTKALKHYFNEISIEWIKRGYTHNLGFYEVHDRINFPPFIGNKKFHDSHKSNLLRKNYEFYSKYGWDVPDNLPYVWVIKK